MVKLENITWESWKGDFLDKVWFDWMFKLDKITWGTWKPHFLDKGWFNWMFKLDNITGGTWKIHFLDKAWFLQMLKLHNITRGTWKSNFFDRASFVCLAASPSTVSAFSHHNNFLANPPGSKPPKIALSQNPTFNCSEWHNQSSNNTYVVG